MKKTYDTYVARKSDSDCGRSDTTARCYLQVTFSESRRLQVRAGHRKRGISVCIICVYSTRTYRVSSHRDTAAVIWDRRLLGGSFEHCSDTAIHLYPFAYNTVYTDHCGLSVCFWILAFRPSKPLAGTESKYFWRKRLLCMYIFLWITVFMTSLKRNDKTLQIVFKFKYERAYVLTYLRTKKITLENLGISHRFSITRIL